MRRFAIAVFGAGSLAAMSVSAMADTATFDATATTQAALSVTCGANLRFGTLGVEPSNAAATITVNQADGAAAVAVSSDEGAVYPITGSGPADCTITNETGTDATATLGAISGNWTSPTLAGVNLTEPGAATLSADITLSKAGTIGNETIYIGGVLRIPLNHNGTGTLGTYDETITLTVTD